MPSPLSPLTNITRVPVYQAAVEAQVKADERLEKALTGRNIVKFIYVKGRLANIVTK